MGRGGGRTGGGRETVICFGTYNIWNFRNGGLDSSLRGVDWTNPKLMGFQETKAEDRVHTRTLVVYRIFATASPIRHHVGVDLFYRDAHHFQDKAL